MPGFELADKYNPELNFCYCNRVLPLRCTRKVVDICLDRVMEEVDVRVSSK